jgi:dTDP-4-dehydrorhamnose reductase
MKQKLLIFGGAGLVGSKFIELFKNTYEITAPEIDDLDILNKNELFEFVKKQSSEVVINYAAFTNVDKAEEEKGNKNGLVYKLNALAPKDLAEICLETNKQLIHYSTDYVFDGRKEEGSYAEEDIPNPVNWYGETKYIGEKFVLENKSKNTIIRISMPFSSKYDLKQDIARFFLNELKQGKAVTAIDDQFVTPVFVDDASKALDAIISNRAAGIFHTVSSSSTTPFKFAQLLADKFGLDKSLVKSVKLEDYNKTRLAKRIKNGCLSVSKFEEMFGKGILQDVKKGIDKFTGQIV